MALIYKDRVKETTTTTGQGTLTLAGAVTGFQAFSVVGNSNTCHYTLLDVNGIDWEIGVGTYTLSGTTLARTTVLTSSAGGTTKITLSATGSTVFLTPDATSIGFLDTANTFTAQQTLTTPILGTPASGTLTNCTALPVAGITASTSTALGVGSVELGHASDTTLARVSAGVVSVEGVNVLTVAGGTLTGNITLGENTSIALDPAGSADGKYSGITVAGTAGEALAFGDVIVLDVTAGKWFKGSVSAAAAADGDLRGGTGMCVLAAAGDASATTVLLMGTCRADANFPPLTVGSVVYASTTGDIIVAQPSTTDHVIKVLGFALTADEIMFSPSMNWITHT